MGEVPLYVLPRESGDSAAGCEYRVLDGPASGEKGSKGRWTRSSHWLSCAITEPMVCFPIRSSSSSLLLSSLELSDTKVYEP